MYQTKNRDRAKTYAHQYWLTHKEELDVYHREYRAKNADHRRRRSQASRLLRKYGITKADWEALYRDQGGACPVCRAPISTEVRLVCVDHSHKTGAVRGLLHKGCNTLVGYLEHPLVEAGRRYLQQKEA